MQPSTDEEEQRIDDLVETVNEDFEDAEENLGELDLGEDEDEDY